MNYIVIAQEIFGKLSDFITSNQMLIGLVLLIGGYFLKRFIDHKAADPRVDIYDTLKPGSDAFYKLIHSGVEYRAKLNPMSSAAKLEDYLAQIQKFEKLFATDKLRAIQELLAWYFSIKNKIESISANPSTPELTKDTPAQE